MEWLTNALSMIVVNFTNFFTMCKQFFQSIINFFNSTWSILSTLWFWLKTLLNWSMKLINEIFSWSLFDYLYEWFNQLQLYVGFAWATFIASLLFVCMVRIAIWFVFKMFRLNIDYKTMKTKRK